MKSAYDDLDENYRKDDLLSRKSMAVFQGLALYRTKNNIWFLIIIFFLQSLRTETALVQKPVEGTDSKIVMKQKLAFTFTEQVYISCSSYTLLILK